MKLLASVLIALAGIGSAIGFASAARPVSPACVGQTVSTGAQVVHPYGGAISTFARDTSNGNRPGVGDDVQALQAGDVPDTDFPNICND